jgi:hypothetical protein
VISKPVLCSNYGNIFKKTLNILINVYQLREEKEGREGKKGRGKRREVGNRNSTFLIKASS